MSDYCWDAVPPGGYWEPDDDLEVAEHQSLADAILDSAIEDALLRRAERKLNASLHKETN